MKNILIILSLSLFALMFGCNNNDEELPQKKFVLDTRRPLNADGIMLSWILLSDVDGNPIEVIDTDKSYEEVSYNPNTSEPYWVSVVQYFFMGEKSVSISTTKFVDGLDTLYAFIRPFPDKYVINKTRYPLDEGNAYVNLASLDPSVYSMTVGSRGYTDYTNFHTIDRKDILPFTTIDELSDCYVTVQDSYEFEPKYFFLPDVANDDTLVLEPASLKVYDSGFNISLPFYTSNTRQTIGIKNNSEAYCTFYSVYNNQDTYPIRYVDNLFDSYLTNIRYYIADEKRSVEYWQKSSAPLGSFDLISNTMEYTSNSDGSLEISYSGTASLAVTNLEDNNNYLNDWYIVFNPNDSYVAKPIIPETVLNQISLDTNLDFTLGSTYFYHYSFLKSYNQVISFGNKEFPSEYTYYSEGFNVY